MAAYSDVVVVAAARTVALGWHNTGERFLAGVRRSLRRCVGLRQLRLDGHDVMALGVKAKAVGVVLHHLRAQVLQVGQRNQAPTLRRLVREYLTLRPELARPIEHRDA